MTTIITGRTLTLTIDGDDYTAQCTSATINPTNNNETWQTLAGPVSRRTSESFELQIVGFQDWNAASSMAEALWTAAVTNTPVGFTLEVTGGGTWSGDVIPQFPTAGGDAASALEMDVTFPIDGTPTYTP